jgi:hypothetical protein
VSVEAIEEELRLLDFKLAQLKRDYDQYFLGNRPREPVQLRGEINKTVIKLTNTAIKNTAARFKFSSVCSRFQAYRRQWDDTLRRIEEGTYERHRFKAKIHAHPVDEPADADGAAPGTAPAGGDDDLYQSYVDARLACGESVKGLSRAKLDKILAQQRAELRARYGDGAEFSFRVKVEDGKVRLKASRMKGAAGKRAQQGDAERRSRA